MSKRCCTFVMSILVLCSCTTLPTSVMSSVNPLYWDSKVHVCFANNDTLSLRKVDIVIRYNNTLRNKTFKLTVSSTSPVGDYCIDTLNLVLPSSMVRHPMASTVAFPYRKDVCLSEKGHYIFELKSEEPLRGVEAIGVSIKNQ